MSLTLTVAHEVWPLAQVFTIARGSKTEAHVVVVQVTSDTGLIGRGESVPYARYGESIGTVIAEIEDAREVIERGVGREIIQGLMTPGAARSAVDAIDRAGFKGIDTRIDPVRDYPAGDVAANLVGYMSVDGQRDTGGGLERSFDPLLAGKDGRETYGHSMIVDPWGHIVAEADHDQPGIVVADIDPAESRAARAKIPNLKNAREFTVRTVEAVASQQRKAS